MKLHNDLKKLDTQIAEFYKLTARFMRGVINKHGLKVYKSEVSRLQDKVNRIKVKDDFPQLYIDNINSIIRIQNELVDFLTDIDYSMSTSEMWDKVAGQGAYKYLENMVRNSPWERRWSMSEVTQFRSYQQLSPYTQECQKAAVEWLPRIKEDILEFGKRQKYLTADFDFRIELNPPEGGSYSRWNSMTKVFTLGSYGFDFYPDNDGVRVDPSTAYALAFHEVIGHGGNQMHSEGLPMANSFTEEIASIIACKPVGEGIASNREYQSFRYLRDNMDRLRLTAEDVGIVVDFSELNHVSGCEVMLYSLAKERELREKGFDVYGYILELSKNPVLAKQVKLDFEQTIVHSWGQIGHVMGEFHYQKMMDHIRDVFGDKFIEENALLIHRATSTGCWSWEVYPRAVEYFIRVFLGE